MLNNLRDSLKPTLEKIGKIFASTGLSPNVFTAIGLGFAFASAIVYGINVEYSLIFGGFLDSIFDKIAEVAIFFGILIGNYADPYLVIIAITLSLLVSYMRAKADSMSIKLQGVGIGERAERLLVIAIIGIIGFMEIALIIVIIIAAITLGQRIIAISKNR